MIYREAGQFKATYRADQGIFTIRQDLWAVVAICVLALVAVPLLASEYLLHSVLLPFLLYSIAAMGLNILLGYCGQISLGTAGFMAVGAFTAYKFATAFEFLPAPVLFILAGLMAALVGVVFGLPSLRIKGFYLAVTTLGAHFLIEWILTNFGWFKNYSPSGVITAPPVTLLGFPIESAESKYVFTLVIAIGLAVLMKNMVRGAIGRAWMAVRDMDVAAEVIGIDLLRTKLIAFAVSSFYCGIAGAMYVFFLSRHGGTAGVHHQSRLLRAVHGHHRRSRQCTRLVSRRRIHRCPADRHQQRARRGGAERAGRGGFQHRADRVRLPDHLLPDRGAGGTRAAVGDREGEASHVAVPLLSAENRDRKPAPHIGRNEG